MLNKTFLMGRLGRDPELTSTQNGVKRARFSLAVTRDYKDTSTGERGTDWINVVAWRQKAEFASRYLQRGRQICVVGRLEESNWTDKDGVKRRDVVVVADEFYFADTKTAGQPAEGNAAEGSFPQPRQPDFHEVDDEGELPF